MRTYKFRAWDKTKKIMIGDYLEHICVSDNVVAIVQYKPGRAGDYVPKSCRQLTNDAVDNLIIQQFVGLKDANGKEIYEGDIVKYTNGKDLDFVGKVWYEETRACFFVFGNDDQWFLTSAIEIIGNVFETPGLLVKEGEK